MIKTRFICLILFLFSLWLSAESSLSEEEIQLILGINTFRLEKSLQPLQTDPLLSACAEHYAQEMVEENFFSHQDLQGNRAMDRYRRMKGSAIRLGENLVSLAPESPWSKTLALWIDSPDHLDVLLDENWLCMGLAFYEQDDRRVGVALFSNSLIIEGDGNSTLSLQDEIILSIPSEGIREIKKGPALDFSLYRGADWRLLELRDRLNRLHNRILLKPADDRADAE